MELFTNFVQTSLNAKIEADFCATKTALKKAIQTSLDAGFTSKEALPKLKMKQTPATGQKLSTLDQCVPTRTHACFQILLAPV